MMEFIKLIFFEILPGLAAIVILIALRPILWNILMVIASIIGVIVVLIRVFLASGFDTVTSGMDFYIR